LKRPSCDQDIGAAQSLFGSDFDAEGLVGAGGSISWLLGRDLLSFSSSLYNIIKRGYLSHGNCNSLFLIYLWNFISKITQILYQEPKCMNNVKRLT
jgi:hypothetical protein